MVNLLFTFVVITTIALFASATVFFYKMPLFDFSVFFMVVGWSLVQYLAFLLPLSLLIAVVFVYGRAAADNEITTIKASGIAPHRVLLPGLLLALGLAAVSFEIEMQWAPWAVYQQRRIPEQQSTVKALLEQQMALGQSMLQFGEKHSSRTIHWQSIENTDQGVALVNVLVEMEGEPKKKGSKEREESTVISASRATVRIDERRECFVLTLTNPRGLSGPMKEFEHGAVALTFTLNADKARDRLKYHLGPELVALARRSEESVEVEGMRVPLLRRYDPADVVGRIHQRLSRAATPLVFLLRGVPLALVFKSGNRMVAFLLASFIAMFVYYPTERLANVLMDQRLTGPVLACWSGNALLALLGLGLLVFVVRR